MSIRHVIKYEYKDGVKLEHPILWCGRKKNEFDWCFLDAQHAALSKELITPCRDCVKSIVDAISNKL